MKTAPRKIISIFLVALMLSSMLPTTVFAATAPKVTAASVEKEMIAGETVDVDVVLSDNPGITGGSVKITFEKTKLKLTNVTNRSETITSPYDGYTGNVKKCAVGKHPKSERLGSTGQAACCARIHSRYFTGGSPSGLRV